MKIIIILLLIYIILSILLGYVLIISIVNARSDDRATIEKFDRMKVDPDYDNVWDRHPFAIDSDGVTIRGEYICNPAGSAPHKVVLLCHGFTGNRFSDVKYGRLYYDMGYDLVIFDHRHCGESGGDHSTLGQLESRDIAHLLAYTREIFGEDIFLGCHGESMGAASELLALDYADPAPDFVVADCPFADSKKLLTYLAKTKASALFMHTAVFFGHLWGKLWQYDFYRVNPIEAVAKADVPICFVHGEADRFIPREHSESMYEVARHPDSELHLVPRADHAKSYFADPGAYKKMLSEFVAKVEKTKASD